MFLINPNSPYIIWSHNALALLRSTIRIPVTWDVGGRTRHQTRYSVVKCPLRANLAARPSKFVPRVNKCSSHPHSSAVEVLLALFKCICISDLWLSRRSFETQMFSQKMWRLYRSDNDKIQELSFALRIFSSPMPLLLTTEYETRTFWWSKSEGYLKRHRNVIPRKSL